MLICWYKSRLVSVSSQHINISYLLRNYLSTYVSLFSTFSVLLSFIEQRHAEICQELGLRQCIQDRLLVQYHWHDTRVGVLGAVYRIMRCAATGWMISRVLLLTVTRGSRTAGGRWNDRSMDRCCSHWASSAHSVHFANSLACAFRSLDRYSACFEPSTHRPRSSPGLILGRVRKLLLFHYSEQTLLTLLYLGHLLLLAVLHGSISVAPCRVCCVVLDAFGCGLFATRNGRTGLRVLIPSASDRKIFAIR